VPGPGKSSPPAFIVGVGDRAGADQFLAGIAPPGKAKSAKQNGSPLTLYPGGFATAYSDDQLLFGSGAAVRVGLDTEAGRVPGLDGSDEDAARDELPDVRFAKVFLSRPGVQRTLVGRQGGATQLETFVDYGATTGVAASATAKDDGIEVNLVSQLDPGLLERSPTFFANLPEFEPDLTGEAGERALAPFRALATPIADMVQPMPYPQIYPPDEEDYHPTAVAHTMFVDAVDLPPRRRSSTTSRPRPRRWRWRSCGCWVGRWRGCPPGPPHSRTAAGASWSPSARSTSVPRRRRCTRPGSPASRRRCTRATPACT